MIRKSVVILELEKQYGVKMIEVSKNNFEQIGFHLSDQLKAYFVFNNESKITHLRLVNSSSDDLNILKNPIFSKLEYLILPSSSPVSRLDPISELSQLKELYLSSNDNINDLSPLRNLVNLRILSLFDCPNISDLTPIQNLFSLERIALFKTQVSDISALESLYNIYDLRIVFSQVSDISPLNNLSSLKLAFLDYSKITDISPLEKLSNLSLLALGNNNIQDIKPLQHLSELTELSLRNNKVTDITSLKILLNSLPNLKKVYMENNPVNLPSNILNNLEQLKLYFNEQEKGISKRNQIRMFFLGDACVGKSTLISHLINHPNPPANIPVEQRTEGIKLQIWEDQLHTYDINIWDFGGQDIFHNTHRLFFGERAVYVLVWCRKEAKLCGKEESRPLSYWLDFIAEYGRNSIVLIVENIFGEDFGDRAIPDEKKIRELIKTYDRKNIIIKHNVQRFNFKEDTNEITNYKDILKNAIVELQNEFGYEDYPKSWYDLQITLNELKSTKKTITRTEFDQIAQKHNITESELILKHLHDNGILGYYPELDNIVVLQLEWILEAIYTPLKLTNNRLYIKKGKVVKSELFAIWEDLGYNNSNKELFLKYMLVSELISPAPQLYNGEKRAYDYLIPAHFNPIKRRNQFKWDEKDSYIVVRFKFMFKAIMQQLQVRIINYCNLIDEEDLYQNYIAFTDMEDNDAFIEMVEDDKELRIFSKSTKLLETILSELDRIYSLNRVEVFKRYNNGQEEIFHQAKSNNILFNTKNKNDSEVKRTTAFITYAWTNSNKTMDDVHQERVKEFVDQLRTVWGIDATFDLYENEANFIRMMHENMHKNDKIIIVLSEGYAKKASNFEDGVGEEYEIILNDRRDNPNKYILVAFDNRNIEKYPLGFKNTDTIVLNLPLEKDEDKRDDKQNKLLAKILDVPIHIPPPLAGKVAKVRK